jgi:hypothetical protein
VTFDQVRLAPTFFRCAFFWRRGSRDLFLGSNLPFFSVLGVLGLSGATSVDAAILLSAALVSTAFSFFAKLISSRRFRLVLHKIAQGHLLRVG